MTIERFIPKKETDLENITEPDGSQWGDVPNANRHWTSTDILYLVIENLTTGKGCAWKTSKPFSDFIRLAVQIVTDVKDYKVDRGLSNLSRSGVAYFERKTDETRFLFSLRYLDEEIPTDSLWELDPKTLMMDENAFDKVHGELQSAKGEAPPVAKKTFGGGEFMHF